MVTDSRCAGAIPCYLNDNGECVATEEWMCTRPQWAREHPLRVVTLCSGYDSQCLALDALKEHYPSFDYDLVAWAEFDPASKQPIEKQPARVLSTYGSRRSADRHHSLCRQQFSGLCTRG